MTKICNFFKNLSYQDVPQPEDTLHEEPEGNGDITEPEEPTQPEEPTVPEEPTQPEEPDDNITEPIDEIVNRKYSDLKPIDLAKIKLVEFPENQYFKEVFSKNQIILHHTVSGPGPRGDLDTWIRDTRRIATCIILDNEGIPHQLYSSKYWAYNTGVSSWLDKQAIAIEIDNWGPLVLGTGENHTFGNKVVKTVKGKFYAAYGNVVDVEVQHYPKKFRGYKYYEKYTERQIRTTGELLLYWNRRYGIPIGYNEDMWDVSPRALEGWTGVWTHVSYRKDKSDCHPQPELIEMLKVISTMSATSNLSDSKISETKSNIQ